MVYLNVKCPLVYVLGNEGLAADIIESTSALVASEITGFCSAAERALASGVPHIPSCSSAGASGSRSLSDRG